MRTAIKASDEYKRLTGNRGVANRRAPSEKASASLLKSQKPSKRTGSVESVSRRMNHPARRFPASASPRKILAIA
jgi:hypothetical protein